ncbi:MAG: tail fiber domain-containing protein, partial [Gammaproteobacteria bacterium]|nr:tail fiber domain-containing protein [Gammaproteobacteria bacterium]
HIQKPNTANPILKLGNSNQPTREWYFDVDGAGDFSLSGEGGGTPYTMLYIDETNKFLGVGTTAPFQNLHVEGTNSILRLQSSQTTSTSNSYIEFGNTPAGSFDSKGHIGNVGSGDHIEYNALTWHRFNTQNVERMRLTNAGELILGNFTAFSQLDVNEQITMRQGATNGYLPVSDNNGTMTWTDPSTIIPAALWSNSAGSVYPTTLTDKVGVGTSTPVGQFDVTTSTLNRGSQIQNSFNSNSDKYGLYVNASGAGTGDNIGVWGESFGTGTGTNYGIAGQALGSGPENRAVYGNALSGTVNWAGYFDQGDVFIQNRLGINTTGLPSYPLHVEGNTQLNGVTQMNGSSGLAATLKVFGGLGSGVVYIFDGTGTKALSVFSGGQVGIGAGPTGTTGILHIQDNDANTTGASGSHVNIQNLANATNTTAGLRFRTGGSTAVNGDSHYKGAIFFEDGTGSQGEGDMIFAVNNVASSANVTTADAQMTISRYGDFGFGIAPNTSRKLYANTATHQYAAYFLTNRTAGSNYGLYASSSSTGGTFNVGVYARTFGASTTNYGLYGNATGGGTNWSLYSNGPAYSSTGTWSGSDEKLKKNIQEFTGAIDKLKQLDIKTYNFKTEEYKGLNFPDRKQYGLMAQNLENVFPELVMESEHYIPDAEGKLTEESVTFKAVNYSQLIPVLIKGMQEQQKMIEELKQEIEDLKNN